MKARLYWKPLNGQGTVWALMLQLDWEHRRLALLQRSVSGGWEVPVSGGAYRFDRASLDRAVDRAERYGCGEYGLAPPLWRLERSQLTSAAARGTLRA